MSVEAPGGVRTPAAYWAALSEARELIGPLPRDRGWPVEDMLSLSRLEGFADVCDAGGFIENPGAFDPVFFNMSRREAVGLESADPPRDAIGLECVGEHRHQPRGARQ